VGDDRTFIACAEDADEAMSLLCHDTYDLVLLNMSANPTDGFTLISRLRAGGDSTALLALTGREISDRVRAIELGADDALAEPVDTAQVRARMTAMARRNRASGSSVLSLGELSLCTATREVRFRDQNVALSDKECALLELMFMRRGTILTKTSFLNYLYDELDEPEINIIDVFICKLRKKLERAGAIDPICTIWGQGYMLREPAMYRQHMVGDGLDVETPLIA
jgi:two-component system cell cycle response regulator CtrA